MIRSVKGGFVILSEDGTRRLSKVYKSKSKAKKRLREIEYFKNKSS